MCIVQYTYSTEDFWSDWYMYISEWIWGLPTVPITVVDGYVVHEINKKCYGQFFSARAQNSFESYGIRIHNALMELFYIILLE